MKGREMLVVASLLGTGCLVCGCQGAALNGGRSLAPTFGISGPPAQSEPPITAEDTTPRRGATPTAFDQDDESGLRSAKKDGLLKRIVPGKPAEAPRKTLPVNESGAELEAGDAFDF
jgi:hypothetical protein